MTNYNPFIKPPIYETEQFMLRKVSKQDAEDLLYCYSDPISAKHFNSDNCTSDFVFKNIDEMKKCIDFWEQEYRMQYYIRFSVIHKNSGKVIGTIEIAPRKEGVNGGGKVGVLRLDIASKFEKEAVFDEILYTVIENLYQDFELENIITKAIPDDLQRIKALKNNSFIEIKRNSILPYDYYFIRKKDK